MPYLATVTYLKIDYRTANGRRNAVLATPSVEMHRAVLARSPRHFGWIQSARRTTGSTVIEIWISDR